MSKSAVDKLSAELAFKANIDAASRDYICEPHVGACCPSIYMNKLKVIAIETNLTMIALLLASLATLQSTEQLPVLVGLWWWLRG